MPPPTVLASEVMDISAAILNDTALTIFTYVAQLPYVKMANGRLEKLLAEFDTEVQRTKNSSPITVTAGATTLTLPSDFFLPINLFERAPGATNDQWTPMREFYFEPENAVQTTTLNYWCFRNNNVNFIGSLNNREVLMEYERMIAVITGSSSPTDTYLAKDYLGAQTAEFVARYVGMNSIMANEIRDNEVAIAKDDLTRILVHNRQSLRFRRGRFTTKPVVTIIR